MPSHSTTQRRLGDLLAGDLTVGEPDVVGALAVFPVFGPPPRHRLATLAEALDHGATARELPSRASDNDLWVSNETVTPVLVFPGEELRGAQQRCVCHQSCLVPAGRSTSVPVYRLGDERQKRVRLESFASANRICPPSVRRFEATVARTRGTPRFGTGRPALPDLLDRLLETAEDTAPDVEEQARRVLLREEQCGAVALVGSALIAFDYVERSSVYAALHRQLVRGYLVDARGREASAPPCPPKVRVQRFVDTLRDTPVVVGEEMHGGASVRPTAGSSRETTIEGAGLVVDDVLVQWSAFPA